MSRITSITLSEEPETVYDPCCEWPHAYLSNRFVSHNCVVIFDEVEKIFQNQSDQGVTSSMLSQVLWWLQEHKTKVFTVMTTNNRKIIPSELYREGRIDEVMVFEGVEGLNDCTDFSIGAFSTLMDEMKEGYEVVTVAKEIKNMVKTMFLDSNYVVPQAKLIQLVYSYIKSLLNGVEK